MTAHWIRGGAEHDGLVRFPDREDDSLQVIALTPPSAPGDDDGLASNTDPFLPPKAFVGWDENATGVVYTAVATDPDPAASVRYVLTGDDADLFDIDPFTGEVTWIAPPDFESPLDVGRVDGDNFYFVTIVATDSAGAKGYQTLGVNVRDVEEAPVLGPDEFIGWDENASGAVYTASAADGDGDAFTYSLVGNDSALFSIDAVTGEISWIAPPDFETPLDIGRTPGDNFYFVTIVATDTTGEKGYQTLGVKVRDVAEGPEITSPVAVAIDENTSEIYDAEADDATPGDGVTWSITGGADAALFQIDSLTGEVTVAPPPPDDDDSLGTLPEGERLPFLDFENPLDFDGDNVYEIEITASDAGGSDSQTVEITVNDVNEAPGLGGLTFASGLSENVQLEDVVYTANDPEGTEVTLSIGGEDADDFNLDADTGELTWAILPDFENPADADTDNEYNFTITGTDEDGLTNTLNVTLIINDQNDAPEFTSATSVDVAENDAGVIYTATGTDQDNDTLDFRISGGADQALFTIDPNTGELRFFVAPDFETPGDADGDNVYEVEIAVGDDGSPSEETPQLVSITLTDQNEAPSITSGASISVGENNTETGYVGTATDPDAGDGQTWSITGGADQVLFEIDSATGALSFLNAPDFETPADNDVDNTYVVQIAVTDDGGAYDIQSVSVTVANHAEAAIPFIVDLSELAAVNGFLLQGDSGFNNTGWSASNAGDVNGDGIDDLIIGAPFVSSTTGNAFVVFGQDTSLDGDFGATVTAGGYDRQVIDLTFLSASEGFVIVGDATYDRAGYSVSNAGDVNGDGIDDLIIGAIRGADGGNAAGEAYVVFGKNTSEDGDFGVTNGVRQVIDVTMLSASEGFVIQGDAADDRLGFSVSNAGDVNGDGIDDLIVGAKDGNDGGSLAGEAYVIFGKDTDADGDFGSTVNAGGYDRQVVDVTALSDSEGFIIQGDGDFDEAGRSVSNAGDVNGDGIDDLIIGAARGNEVFVVFGKDTGADGPFGQTVNTGGYDRQVVDLTTLSAGEGFLILGDGFGDEAGLSVSSAGDVNGDGIADLIIGAPDGNDGGADAGEAYVIFGKDTSVDGAFGASDNGNGYDRQVLDLTALSASEGFIIQGDTDGDLAGFSVSNAGDVNGDGIDDLIIGARDGDDGGDLAGEAYVLFGKDTSADGDFGSTVNTDGYDRQVIDLSNLTADDGFIIQGDEAGDFAGRSVSAAGDINNDGFDDLIVGAPGGDDAGGYSGESYIIYGGPSVEAPVPPPPGPVSSAAASKPSKDEAIDQDMLVGQGDKNTDAAAQSAFAGTATLAGDDRWDLGEAYDAMDEAREMARAHLDLGELWL